MLRPDRDDHIRIVQENVVSGRMENFYVKSPADIDSLGVPYDYNSIMHYRKVASSQFSTRHVTVVLEHYVYVA